MKQENITGISKSQRRAYIFLFTVLVAFLILYFLIRLPKSDAFHVYGVVITKSSSQGYRSGDMLKVQLNDGSVITVSNEIQAGVRSGDRIEMSAYERYLQRPRYQYLSNESN